MGITLNNEHIYRIIERLYKYCGIFLSDSKVTMIKNRASQVMRETGIEDIDVLLNRIEKDKKIQQFFINAFTTNKTEFFREYVHFQDMIDRSLPMLFKSNNPIKIFCSAASTGQEPYSIAMSVLYAKELYDATTPVSIIATDIDTSVLQEAANGIYTVDFRLEKFPNWCNIDEYFDVISSNKQPYLQTLKVKNKVKSMITFKQLNLFNKSYPFMRDEFHILFCRNVLIYFKQEDQKGILSRLINTLCVGGTFYLGHSESLYELSEHFEKLGNKTYVKFDGGGVYDFYKSQWGGGYG